MVYNPDDYVIDFANNQDPDSVLNDGAVLYRITSRNYADPAEILTGNGAALGVTDGRFHWAQQRTTYCANNVIVCLAEKLFHLYRGMLDGIRDELPAGDLIRRTTSKSVLVILSIAAIDEIVYADSVGAARSYSRSISGSQKTGSSITGPSITCPDSYYLPLQKFAHEVRKDKKKGVVFPSARHSEGFAYALFRDETQNLKSNPFERLEVQLQLISENEEFQGGKRPGKFDIHTQKLHPTVGYYEFLNSDAFDDAKTKQLIHPDGISCKGYIDFVRRRYDKTIYPATAHWPCQ
jgi:hypothetical protein